MLLRSSLRPEKLPLTSPPPPADAPAALRCPLLAAAGLTEPAALPKTPLLPLPLLTAVPAWPVWVAAAPMLPVAEPPESTLLRAGVAEAELLLLPPPPMRVAAFLLEP